jgi:N-acetylmuramoyl-L-alanine amidase
MTIIDKRSPNQNERPAGVLPGLIVIHGTVGSDAGDLAWLTNPASKVSYHYLIQRAGTTYRLVDDTRRAWHAGASSWRGRANVNDYSLGIGLSNKGDGELFTDAQYKACGSLCRILMRRWNITLDEVVGHYHISPGRKTDPWYVFEWGRLFAELGLRL